MLHTSEEFLVVSYAGAGVHEAVVILISKIVVRQDVVGIDMIEHIRIHLLRDDDRRHDQEDY